MKRYKVAPAHTPTGQKPRYGFYNEKTGGQAGTFSTADEALDIPELEVIHLVYPTRNAPLLTQQIGRVERHHKDKDNCVVYDYVDKSTPILWMQFVDRRINVYNKNNYTIKTNFQKR
mgnify:CR=1 FL=1